MARVRVTRADVRRLLDEWARWRARQGSYAMGTLGRTDGLVGDVPPSSRIPVGVEAPALVKVVSRGLEHGVAVGYGDAMAVVQAVYLRGHGSKLEDVAQALGISRTVLADRRSAGEDFLVGFLSAGG